MGFNKRVEVVINIFLIIFIIILILLILEKLLGHSPTIEEILLMLVAGLILESLRIEFKLGEFTEFKNTTSKKLDELRKDIKEIKAKL